jgi:hypothetical protein
MNSRYDGARLLPTRWLNVHANYITGGLGIWASISPEQFCFAYAHRRRNRRTKNPLLCQAEGCRGATTYDRVNILQPVLTRSLLAR